MRIFEAFDEVRCVSFRRKHSLRNVAKIARDHGISCAKQGFIINKILPDITLSMSRIFRNAKNQVLIKHNRAPAAANIAK
jgi:hypothetical protein